MAKVGKFCLAKRVKVEWLFQYALIVIVIEYLETGNTRVEIVA